MARSRASRDTFAHYLACPPHVLRTHRMLTRTHMCAHKRTNAGMWRDREFQTIPGGAVNTPRTFRWRRRDTRPAETAEGRSTYRNWHSRSNPATHRPNPHSCVLSCGDGGLAHLPHACPARMHAAARKCLIKVNTTVRQDDRSSSRLDKSVPAF